MVSAKLLRRGAPTAQNKNPGTLPRAEFNAAHVHTHSVAQPDGSVLNPAKTSQTDQALAP
jgi:hypothetical protein